MFLRPFQRVDASPEFQACCDTVRRDFWMSFRFSQGFITLQLTIFRLLAYNYTQTFPEVQQALLPKAISHVKDGNRGLPKAHAPLQVGEFKTVSAVRSRQFRQAVRQALQDCPSAYQYQTDLHKFNRLTIERDLNYQEDRRHLSRDPHASIFRQYVALGSDRGHNTMATIFADARIDAIRSSTTPSYLQQYAPLVRRWEVKHPGQEFLPPELHAQLLPKAAA